MIESNDIERAIDALHSIPPTIGHDTRVLVGMAAKEAGITFEEYDFWQSTNPRYDALEVRSMWNSYHDGAIKRGTLFKIAADHGYRNGDKPKVQATLQRTSKAIEPLQKPAKGNSPAEVWERCEAATAQHPYIVTKGATSVPLLDLRVVKPGDSLRIGGASLVGYLVVPAYAPDGLLQSLVFISPNGANKLNLRGARIGGTSFTVGWTVPGCRINICEGIATAWACWQASGAAAVCCFGWPNVAKVARAWREKDPSAQVTLVVDVGKEKLADKIAAEIGACVVKMPAGNANNFDANDLAQRDGYDVLDLLLDGAAEPPKPEPRLKPVSVFDVVSHPSQEPTFVWDGYLPRGNVTLLGAHGGVGKSTLALMLSVCAVQGHQLFGIATTPCKVLFVSLEDGTHVVRHRLAHICKTWAIDPEQLRDHLVVVDGTENPEFFSAESRSAGETTPTYSELRELVQAENFGLVVVDNASDAYGGDEIQRRQVRAFVRSLVDVARPNNCAVMLLAHVDKMTSRNRTAQGGEGYSGSTAWHNAVRSRLFMTRAEDGSLTLEHQKNNLGKMREPLCLTWPDGGLPMLPGQATGLATRHADDQLATELLRLIAEFEARQQYCSPATTSRSNVYAVLKSDPMFQRLKLRHDDVNRIMTQCQRAKWIDMVDYRSPDRKPHQRWTLTYEGRLIAGLRITTAPTAPTAGDGANQNMAQASAPTAPTGVGGVGVERAHKDGADLAQKGN